MAGTIQEPITGNEKVLDVSDPLAALSQFYRALNHRDISLMHANWEVTDDAVMDNPLGGIKRGWSEIRGVYESLFATPNKFHFEFYDYSLLSFSETFIAIGRERGELISAGETLHLAIRTTRVFRRAHVRWRQIHHHGSIDDPQMLDKYQNAVLNRAA
ncbi:MAG: YybH family protein [Acidobacteriaceae bacterium]